MTMIVWSTAQLSLVKGTCFSYSKRAVSRPQLKSPWLDLSRSISTYRVTPQKSITAAYYRGGTSRAIFFQPKHLPTDQSRWAAIFRGAIGSPDPYGRQLDGMGGGISSLSKICVVGPSSHPEADVDYTFVAIGVKDSEVDFSSNCGYVLGILFSYLKWFLENPWDLCHNVQANR